MRASDVALKCFAEGKVMQLGTSQGEQPRVNSVYYVTSDNCRSVYWMSEPRRRHSEDILQNPLVAGAIALKTDWPVVGLQFAGRAMVVDDINELAVVVDKYNEKYDYVAKGFVDRFKDGTNKHSVYKLDITTLELFDQEHFAGDPVTVSFD